MNVNAIVHAMNSAILLIWLSIDTRWAVEILGSIPVTGARLPQSWDRFTENPEA